jgi:hypothetical protein
MTKILSQRKVEDMRDVFECLAKVPYEEKKRWGFHLSDYDFAIGICNTLLDKMERETKRVKSKKCTIQKSNQQKREQT